MAYRLRDVLADRTARNVLAAVAVAVSFVFLANALADLLVSLLSQPEGPGRSELNRQPFTFVVGNRIVAYENLLENALAFALVVGAALLLVRRAPTQG